MNDQTGNGKFKYIYTIPKIYRYSKTGNPYIKLKGKKVWLSTSMTNEQLKKYVEKKFRIKKKIKANVSLKKPKQKKKPQKKGIEQKVSQKVVVINPSDKKDSTPIYQNVSRLDPDVQNLVNKIRTGEVYVSKSDNSKPDSKPKKEPEPKIIKSSIIATPSILSSPPSPSAPPLLSLPSTPNIIRQQSIIPQYEPIDIEQDVEEPLINPKEWFKQTMEDYNKQKEQRLKVIHSQIPELEQREQQIKKAEKDIVYDEEFNGDTAFLNEIIKSYLDNSNKYDNQTKQSILLEFDKLPKYNDKERFLIGFDNSLQKYLKKYKAGLEKQAQGEDIDISEIEGEILGDLENEMKKQKPKEEKKEEKKTPLQNFQVEDITPKYDKKYDKIKNEDIKELYFMMKKSNPAKKTKQENNNKIQQDWENFNKLKHETKITTLLLDEKISNALDKLANIPVSDKMLSVKKKRIYLDLDKDLQKGKGLNELMDGKGKDMGGGLWTSQIIEIMSKVKPFIGCIASDQFDTLLPRIKPNTKLGFISNLSPSTSGGSHWVAIAINATNNKPDSNSIMYYDPFGKDVPYEMLQGLKLVSNKIAPDKMLKFKVNSIQHQDIKSDNCGFFSMKFLLDILTRGKSFSQATGYDDKIKDQSKQREKEIENLKGKAPFNYINMYNGQDGKGIKETVKKVVSKVKDVAKNIYDRVKSIFTGVSGSASLRKFLEQNGKENIVKITVCRKPIMTIIRKTLNLLSFGKLEKNLKQLNYDELFHLFLVLKLSNGKSYRLEKSARIQASLGGVEGESMEVPIKSPINVVEFVDKTKRRMGDKFWVYNMVNNNCQVFVDNLLSANGLNNEQIRKFVKQDVETLFKKMPEYTKIIGKAITDVGGVAETIVQGNGKKKRYN